MSREELVERFSLERVSKKPGVFDYEKLMWMNGVYLRALSEDAYADALVGWLREQNHDWDEELVRRTVPSRRRSGCCRSTRLRRLLLRPRGAGCGTARRQRRVARFGGRRARRRRAVHRRRDRGRPAQPGRRARSEGRAMRFSRSAPSPARRSRPVSSRASSSSGATRPCAAYGRYTSSDVATTRARQPTEAR